MVSKRITGRATSRRHRGLTARPVPPDPPVDPLHLPFLPASLLVEYFQLFLDGDAPPPPEQYAKKSEPKGVAEAKPTIAMLQTKRLAFRVAVLTCLPPQGATLGTLRARRFPDRRAPSSAPAALARSPAAPRPSRHRPSGQARCAGRARGCGRGRRPPSPPVRIRQKVLFGIVQLAPHGRSLPSPEAPSSDPSTSRAYSASRCTFRRR